MSPSECSLRSYSALRILFLLGTTVISTIVATKADTSLSSRVCFQTRHELAEAVYSYLQTHNYSNVTTHNESGSWSIETWCVSNIPPIDDITDLRMEAELTLGVDLSTWEKDCTCDSNDGWIAQNEEHVSILEGEKDDDADTAMDESTVRQKHDTSSPVRSASDTSFATATKIESAATTTNHHDDNEMPMIYRLMPIKLLAALLIISTMMAIRHMVDFRRYEGIDPSDQKNVEFELLQLAQEA
jgi:hypothetical protein